jgi:hypothetical protein
MSETTSNEAETQPSLGQPELLHATGFPPPGLPTVFADAVANLAPLSNTARFYLLRSDPDIGGLNKYHNVPVAQVVMPIEGFAAAVIFLNRALEGLVERGLIPRDRVDSIKQAFEDIQPFEEERAGR